MVGLNWAAINTGELVVTNDAKDIVLTDTALARYGAVLQGFINVDGNAVVTGNIRDGFVSYHFEYAVKGNTASPLVTSDALFSGNNISQQGVSDTIFGLLCGTTYTFRIVGTVASTGTKVAGAWLDFATGTCPAVTVTDESYNSVGVRELSFSSKVNLYGQAAKIHVEYGFVGNTGSFTESTNTLDINVAPGVGVQTINEPISGLKCNTRYGARTVVTLTDNNQIITGAGLQVPTKPCPLPPVVAFDNANIQRVTATSALFSGSVTPHYVGASATFEYRKNGETTWVIISKNVPVAVGSEKVLQRVNYLVNTLNCATDYQVRFNAATEFGNVTSATLTFKTLACGEISALKREQVAGRLAAGGGQVLLIRSDNSIVAWGENTVGQLGSPAKTTWVSEVLTKEGTLISDVVQVAAGFSFSSVRTSTGLAYSWGSNAQGQWGAGSKASHEGLPQAVIFDAPPGDNTCASTSLCNISGIANGATHSLVFTKDGRLYSWGDNAAGELGIGNKVSQNVATHVDGLTRVLEVAAGGSFSLARLSDGTVQAWGANFQGQLGDASTVARAVPGGVGGFDSATGNLGRVAAIAAGGAHALALLDNHTVMAWGANDQDQLGVIPSSATATFETRPGVVIDDQGANLTTVAAVAAGGAHSLALLENSTVMAWGENSWGQLGDGTTDAHDRPRAVMVSATEELTSVVAIAAGDDFSIALLADGAVYGWGNNARSSLGMNNTMNSVYAIPIQGPSGRLDYFARKLVLDRRIFKLGEGKNAATIKVSLARVPFAPQSVNASIIGNKVKFNGASVLQFDESNWDVPQSITLLLDSFDGVAAIAQIRLSTLDYEDIIIPVEIAGATPQPPQRATSSSSGAWGYDLLMLMVFAGWNLLRRQHNRAS